MYDVGLEHTKQIGYSKEAMADSLLACHECRVEGNPSESKGMLSKERRTITDSGTSGFIAYHRVTYIAVTSCSESSESDTDSCLPNACVNGRGAFWCCVGDLGYRPQTLCPYESAA